jgi:hypothetical protein
MFFGRIISYTCDLHLKLDILNPLNIFFFSKWLNESFVFFQNFKTSKFLYDLCFHQVHPMNMYFRHKSNFFGTPIMNGPKSPLL